MKSLHQCLHFYHELLIIPLGDDIQENGNELNILSAVREHFDVKDRDEKFVVSYRSQDGLRSVDFTVKGVKRQLGQTLSSTGLTM